MPPMASPARAEASASLSCASREWFLIFFPVRTNGKIIAGAIANTIRANFHEIKNIRMMAPIIVAMERKAKLTEPVITVSTKVVSVVRRERTSPVRTRSKYAGDK